MTGMGAMVRRLHHVSFGTPNLAGQIDFYCDVLGGAVAHEFHNEANELYGVFIHLGGGSFVEMFNDPAADQGAKSAFRHFAIEVDDLESAAEFLKARGYQAAVKRGRTDQVLQCFVEDPDGNIIELQQHDDRSALFRFMRSRAV